MYFTSRKLTDQITLIEDYSATKMYLIEGSEKAVLIDTGSGFAGLQEFVCSLTELPVEVLITHGHYDHAGGIGQFERVYINAEDISMLHEAVEPLRRLDYARGLCEKYCPPEKLTIQNFPEAESLPEVRELQDGQIFDLGGRKLTAIFAPGHTRGTTVFYDDLSQSLFVGDACNPSSYLFLEGSVCIERYLGTVNKLMNWIPVTRHCYFQHDYGTITCEGPVSIIEDVRECCEQILDRTDDAAAFSRDLVEQMGIKMPLSAKRLDENLMRADGRLGNVIYDPDRIYDTEKKMCD